MHFPEILKELEMKKKDKNSIKGVVLVAITQDKTDGTYTIYTNSKIGADPFVRSMLTRIQNHIKKNYED